MAASLTDKIVDTRNAARPNSARVSSSRSPAATTLACDNLAGWPTASKVHFVTYQIDSNSDPIAGTQVDWMGIVSGNNIGSLTVADGTDAGNSVGDVVEMLPTAKWGQDLADALTAEHGRTGVHDVTKVAMLAGSQTFTGAKSFGAGLLIADTPTLRNVDGWIDANDTWTYASATTITVTSDATTKYDVGDYIKLTQSSTVKYFVITTVAATLLTVSGLAGVTVANSAITANYYSKTRNPHGSAVGGLPFNPYKFSVYRNASWTAGASGNAAKIQFDTKDFDTSSNYDAATNYRFVAPIAGFYFFSTTISMGIVGSAVDAFVGIYKNGSSAKTGDENVQGGSASWKGHASGLLQLAATDYVEVYGYGNGNSAGTGTNNTFFNGFLVSAA